MVTISDKSAWLTLLFIDLNDRINVAWYDGTTWWHHNFGDNFAKQVVVGKNFDGRLEVMYIGRDDSFFYNVYQVATADGQIEWSAPSIPPGKMVYAGKQVAMATNADGRLECFYVGLDNNIYHFWQTSPGSAEWNEFVLSGAAQQIVASHESSNFITIFYIGMDNNIYHNTQTATGWGGDVRAFQGPFYQGTAQALTLANNQDGRVQLFYEGADGFTYCTWQGAPDGLYVGGTRAPSATNYSAFTNTDGLINLFYVGSPDTPPPPDTATFNYTSDDGWTNVEMASDGSFKFWGDFYGGQGPMSLAMVIQDGSANAYIFRHNGKAVGGEPWNTSGNNSAIQANWSSILNLPRCASLESEIDQSDVLETKCLSELAPPTAVQKFEIALT